MLMIISIVCCNFDKFARWSVESVDQLASDKYGLYRTMAETE